MQSTADVLEADLATTERVERLLPFGLAERQARFLASVMLHSGVFVHRQYAAFAGITHGQKVHDFIEKLVARKFVTPIELGSTGRTKIFHVHHKPLYTAIGEPDNRNRRRVRIDRAIERLMILDDVQRLKATVTERAPKTVNNILTTLSVVLRTAVEWGVIERVPCSIKLLKAPKTEAMFHDFDEFERLVEAARSEALALSWSFCSVARRGCDKAR
jgi:hypothetical protein